MKTENLKKYISLHLLFVFYSITTVIAKLASSYPPLSYRFMQYYAVEIVMIMVYAFFWQKVIKELPLVVAYSNKGVIIFWVLIWSVLIFKEKINLNNIIGTSIIILGILMVVKND